MKTLKTTFLLLAIAIFASSNIFISCSKKDEDLPIITAKVFPEENFWQGFINNAGFVNQTSNTGNMSYGFQFKPKVKGKINSFIIKIPQTENNIVVTIRKRGTLESVGKEIFNVTASNSDFVKVITPIQLDKDVSYLIIVSTNSYFNYIRTSSNQVIISGNLDIQGNFYSTSADGGSGIGYFNDYFDVIQSEIKGNISFNFQQTE